jgi:hypothetical protein
MQDRKRPKKIPLLFYVDEETIARLESVSEGYGSKTHIARVGLIKEIELRERQKTQIEKEQLRAS